MVNRKGRDRTETPKVGETVMKRFFPLTSLLVLVGLAILSLASAVQANQVVHFQAQLGNSGSPVPDGTYSASFTVYDDPVGGNALWFESRQVQVFDGVLSVKLGEVSPLDPTVFSPEFGEPYLEIEFNGEVLSPRSLLAAVPTSIVSQSVRGDFESSPGSIALNDSLTESGIEMSTVDTAVSFSLGSHFDPNKGVDIMPGGAIRFDATPSRWDARMGVWDASVENRINPAVWFSGDSLGGRIRLQDQVRDFALDSPTVTIDMWADSSAARIDLSQIQDQMVKQVLICADDTMPRVVIQDQFDGQIQDQLTLTQDFVSIQDQMPGGMQDQMNLNGAQLDFTQFNPGKAAPGYTASFGQDGILFTDMFNDTTLSASIYGQMSMRGFHMYDGSPSGYVLTSDAFGNGTWQPASGGNAADCGWVDDGSVVRLETISDRVGIGSNSPGSHRLYVESAYNGLGGSTIKAENFGSSGIAMWGVTNGSDATMVMSQRGTGDVMRLFSDSAGWVMNARSDGRVAVGDVVPQSRFDLIDWTPWGGYNHVQQGLNVEGTMDPDCPPGIYTHYGIRAEVNVNECDFTNAYGVVGIASGSGRNYGIYGRASGGATVDWAGYFQGNVRITGVLDQGSSTMSIDHPSDPDNMYLNHSGVSSPDMKNVYDGVALLDADGHATVELPEYLEDLNGDFRYQLTCIGGHAPVYVASEVDNNRFEIAGGLSGMKISWQVTGIRIDAFAQQNQVQVVVAKSHDEAGKFLHPEAFGLGQDMSVAAGLADASPEVMANDVVEGSAH